MRENVKHFYLNCLWFQVCTLTAPGDLLLPFGDQEILVFTSNLYAGHPDFGQLLFLEHSLVDGVLWKTNKMIIIIFCETIKMFCNAST